MRRLELSFLYISVLLGVITFTACDSLFTATFMPGLENGKSISVIGTGSVVGEPDIALLYLGVNVEKTSVAEASEAAAGTMTAMLETLETNGIAETDIQTQAFNINPVYDYNQGKRVLRGYNVSNNVTVKVRELDNISKIVDDAAKASGDFMVLRSIDFAIEDNSELAKQARILAVRDAAAKAKTLAEESGVVLGKLISIVESADTYPPAPVAFSALETAASDFGAKSTPIQAGELTVIVNIKAFYEIE